MIVTLIYTQLAWTATALARPKDFAHVLLVHPPSDPWK